MFEGPGLTLRISLRRSLNMTSIDSRELADVRNRFTVVYFELVLRVVVVTRSSSVSFGLPMASTSLPV